MDADISIKEYESLQEHGEELEKCFQDFEKNGKQKIEEAMRSLEGWVSENKDLMEEKIKDVLPEVEKMAEEGSSYGRVAAQTGRLIIAYENDIKREILNG